jgi:signal transduction histidine kinase
MERERIAVIDDHEGTRYSVRRLLESAGYEVVEGACGEDALRLAAEQPSLILLDIHLPDLLGTEVARRIKRDEATSSIPILHLSASSVTEMDRASGLESGADAYLTEPVEPALLLATVKALLRARRAEHVARRALGVVDDFVAIASHDVKGALHAVQFNLRTQLHTLESGRADAAKLGDRLERCLAEVNRTVGLLEHLLDASQLQAGRITLRLENVDLDSIVAEVVGRWEEAARRAGSEIIVDQRAKIVGRFDSARVGQILDNLLSNAMKYGAGRPIRVSLSAAQGRAQIVVTDEGPGIAPDEQQRIFERFERGASNAAPGSYGLGLWIARQVAVVHGGTLSLRSAPGAGSSFTLTLPLKCLRQRAQRIAAKGSASPRTTSVLPPISADVTRSSSSRLPQTSPMTGTRRAKRATSAAGYALSSLFHRPNPPSVAPKAR